MKKAFILLSGLLLSTSLLFGCGGAPKSTEAKEAYNAAPNVSNEIEAVPQEAVSEEISDDIADPLIDNSDVEYIGTYERNDNITKKLLTSLIEKENLNPMNILTVSCSDYNNDGDDEAFVFVISDDSREDTENGFLTGDCYFVNKTETKKLVDSGTEMWSDTGRFVNYGDRKFFVVSEQYGTGANSILYSVYDGKPKMDDLSYQGYFYINESGDSIITASEYDTTYDKEMGIFIGHSWKSYYCHYDPEEDVMMEYGGTEVDVDKLDEICGTNISEEINNLDGYIISAYYRPNGIININYFTNDDTEASFQNATFDLNQKGFIKIWDDDMKNELAKYDQGGIFAPVWTTCPASYEELVSPETRSIDLTIFSTSNAIRTEKNQVIIFGSTEAGDDVESPFMNKAYIIDEATILEPLDNENDMEMYYAGYEEHMSALEWIDKLRCADEDMVSNGISLLGVYNMTVTGSHVDKIHGLFWWD